MHVTGTIFVAVALLQRSFQWNDSFDQPIFFRLGILVIYLVIIKSINYTEISPYKKRNHFSFRTALVTHENLNQNKII